MPNHMIRTIRRTLTFILLTAASFWLFACQASAVDVHRLSSPTLQESF